MTTTMAPTAIEQTENQNCEYKHKRETGCDIRCKNCCIEDFIRIYIMK